MKWYEENCPVPLKSEGEAYTKFSPQLSDEAQLEHSALKVVSSCEYGCDRTQDRATGSGYHCVTNVGAIIVSLALMNV